MTPDHTTHQFLDAKFRTLEARAGRLLALTPRWVGLRPQDGLRAPAGRP
jgi:hypothetical protein